MGSQILYHARLIGLGLSVTTGLVSPAYHAKYDDMFTTISPQYTTYVPKSLWQTKCGFQKEPQTIELRLAAGNNTNAMQDTTNSPLRVNVSNPINNIDEPTAMDIDNDPSSINDNTTTDVSDNQQESERITTRSGREVRAAW
jgi:hypothetical protein